ncbi:hypothetical protein [Streptomyces sp. NPDC093097]|uniref:hypothetical protein n=1 Tax=Streptomyces sp. NPDC093097 TaxID=3366027 RepID=UPI0037FE1F83
MPCEERSDESLEGFLGLVGSAQYEECSTGEGPSQAEESDDVTHAVGDSGVAVLVEDDVIVLGVVLRAVVVLRVLLCFFLGCFRFCLLFLVALLDGDGICVAVRSAANSKALKAKSNSVSCFMLAGAANVGSGGSVGMPTRVQI